MAPRLPARARSPRTRSDPAAGERDDLADEEVRLFGSQVHGEPRRFLAPREPPGGNVLDHLRQLLRVRGEGGREVRRVLDVVLGDGVDLDAVLRDLATDRPREPVDAGPRGGVRRVVGEAGEGGGRRHVDHLAAPRRPHHAERRPEAVERLVEEPRHHLAPGGVAHLVGGAARGRMRVVVDQDVEAAEAGHHGLHRAVGVGRSRQVAAERQHVPPEPLGQRGQRLQRGLVAIVESDRRALAAELLGDGRAHEVRDVRDERDLSGQLHAGQRKRDFSTSQGHVKVKTQHAWTGGR
jgi:hypothetical protein